MSLFPRAFALALLALGAGAAAQTAAHVPARGVAWTTTFDTPNAPGNVSVTVVGAAPDGGVCALTEETLPGNEVGAVVARYGADGAERWSHAVTDWAEGDILPYDVVAVGEACVAGAVLDETFGRSEVVVARVEAGGVAWAVEVARPSPESPPDRVLVEPDGSGGVWVGTGERGAMAPPAVLARLDAAGAVVAWAMFAGDPSSFVGGVRALATLPDGRAVAVVNARTLAVVAPDGTAALTPFADGFWGTALVLDPAVSAAFVLGTTPANEAAVQRLALDGTATWATTLSVSDDRSSASFASPNAIALDGDALYVAWGTSDTPRLARLDAATGAAGWEAPVGAARYRPQGVVVDAAGPVVSTASGPGTVAGYAAADGAERWSATTDATFAGRAPTLVPCADGGSCVAGAGTISARTAAGDVAWAAVREGAPYAEYRIQTLFAVPGGVLVTGRRGDGAGGLRLWVARLTADGAVAWSMTPAPQTRSLNPLGGAALLPDGGVVVAATSLVDGGTGDIREVVVAVGPDGAERWVQTPDGFTRGIVAMPDGGVVVALDTFGPTGLASTRLVRYGPDGAEAWTTEVPDEGPLFAFGLVPTPDGVAVAQFVFGSPAEIRIDRVFANGALGDRTGLRGVGGCEVMFGNGLVAGADAAGTVYVGATQSNGPTACARANVIRFFSDGSFDGTRLSDFGSDSVTALDAWPGGGASVVYGGRYAQIDAGGVVREDLPFPEGSVLTDVVVGPSTQSFLAGYGPGDEASGTTAFAWGTRTAGGSRYGALPRLGGRSTRSGSVALDGRTGYVALETTVRPVAVAGVTQVTDAVPVLGEAAPASSTALLAAVGPNPVRAGAAVRVRLGAPARLALYDALGRRVATWPEAGGEVTVVAPVAAGVYVLRAEGAATAATARLVVVR